MSKNITITKDDWQEFEKRWELIDKKTDLIVNNLYKMYLQQQKDDSEDHFFKKVKTKFWNKVVKDSIRTFKRTWDLLDGKYIRNNEFVYGDSDVSLWVEYPKNLNKKVIISTRHCDCADDNTHIFILEENLIGTIFRVVTVWPREVNKGGYKTAGGGWHSWGDDRDVSTPSINTYRKRDFHFGYYDCRDKGHCFLYRETKFPNMPKELPVPPPTGEYNENKVQNALWTLKTNLIALLDVI